MVQSIDFIALRDGEYLQMLSDTIVAVETNNAVAAKAQAKLTILKDAYSQSSDLFKIPRDSPFSAVLIDFDTRRNNAIIGIGGIVRSYRKHFDENYREAAKLLHRNLTSFGKNIYLMNYQSKSTIFEHIVEVWEDELTLKAAATLLHLDDWTAELKESNALFNEYYILRTQEYGAKSKDTFRQKRVEGMAAFKNFIQYLEALALTDNSLDFTPVLREIDASLDQYDTMLNRRKGNKKKEQLEELPIPENENLAADNPEE